MRRTLKTLLWFGLAAAAAGIGIAWLGLISISASTEHWAPAKWFLHFTMRESVQTQARKYEAPPLDDPRLLRRGASFYAVSCASCHGAPGQRAERFAELMVPPAPSLPESIPEWKSRELFWIVKNGIKYTAMPSWPSQQRDDEVWALVAFLRKLPELTPAQYRVLAYGAQREPAAAMTSGQSTLSMRTAACASCHGEDGLGRDGTAPRIAGQSRQYLETALADYAAGNRESGVMQPIAMQLSAGTIRDLAAFYAELPRTTAEPASYPTVEATSRGEHIALHGIPERDVAACGSCHAQRGDSTLQRFPILDGEDLHELELQLSMFRSGVRAHTANARLMQSVSSRMTDEEARDVATYYAAKSPPRSRDSEPETEPGTDTSHDAVPR